MEESFLVTNAHYTEFQESIKYHLVRLKNAAFVLLPEMILWPYIQSGTKHQAGNVISMLIVQMIANFVK